MLSKGNRTRCGLCHLLVGLHILVTTKRKKSWTALVLEVLERDAGRILVRDSGKPAKVN